MVLGYLRVSKDTMELKNQKYEIMEYAHKNSLKIDDFIEAEVSSRKDIKKRKITEVFERLKAGDTLIVSELSRIGRSTGEVVNLVNDLIAKQVRFIAIKQNLQINGQHDIQSKVVTTMFSLFSELERDLISTRTKQALASRKAQGIILGRPKGKLGTSRLDDKKQQIEELLSHKVSKSAIARILGVSRTTVLEFIKSRKLQVS